MTVGEKIRIARRLRNYTQAELGNMVKVPGDMIRKYENDVRTPKADRLALIAQKLDIDISALSAINITSIDDILHIFFELEKSYGLDIRKIDNEYVLNFDKSTTPRELFYALDAWYESKKKFASLNADDSDKDYEIWKMRYPLDIKSNESKQTALIQSKYSDLVQAIKEEELEIVTFKDIVLVFEKMLKSGIEIEFHIEHIGVGQGLGIFCFRNSQLLSLESSVAIHYASFLYAVKRLSEYGITIQQGTHTFKNDTFTEHYIYNSQISTMISTLRNLQQWIKEDSLNDFENRCEYQNSLKWMNVPIKEYV